MISETEIVLILFLIFEHFESRCSYKIVLIKNKERTSLVSQYPTVTHSHNLIRFIWTKFAFLPRI